VQTNNLQYARQKVIVGLQSTRQNERYVRGIFDNEAKISEQ